MAFDGLVTTAVAAELNEKLLGGRIDKIYQPASDEIIINIHCGREKRYLYISANTAHAGMYLIEEKGSNPQTPPAFCMLLRKHLQSARIREIRQVESERIVEIYTDAVNELGFNVKHKLVVEIMGKHSNILLIDLASNKILDCIKRISGDLNRYRQTLPGVEYVAPPSQNKLSYFNLSYDNFKKIFSDIQIPPEKLLLYKIQGISPVISNELWFRAENAVSEASGFFESESGSAPAHHESININGSVPAEEKLAKALYKELTESVKQASSGSSGAYIYINADGAPAEFHALPITMLQGATTVRCDSISKACNDYFEGRTSSNRIKQKASDMRKAVSSGLDKLFLKKQRLNEDLLQAEDSEKYRLYGELLTASLHTVKEGRSTADVMNYYDNTMMTIPLDPRYTASQNAQRYFKKYAKSKTAIVEKNVQLKETEEEIAYMDSVLTYIENAKTADDLEDIRTELTENGILKKRSAKEKARKMKLNPYEYKTSSGKRILVGRNNKENDILTFKTASSRDIWLHTKDIPGSHVILFTEGNEPSEEEIFEAASLAAFHSKAKMSNQVPVDYVPVKYVKKPAGSKPGYVIFTHNKTVYAAPKEPEKI